MKKKTGEKLTFNEKTLREELVKSALAIGMPEGAAEAVASKVAAKTASWVTTRAVITIDDLHRRVAMEAEKYNTDLAYIYQNRGKII